MHPEATPDGPGDWYALLGLPPTATADQIAEAADRLASAASASSATAPEVSRDLYRQIAALRADLLSGDDRRRRYDELLAHREWAAATQSSPAVSSPAVSSPAVSSPSSPAVPGNGPPPAGERRASPAYRLGDAPVSGDAETGDAVSRDAVSRDAVSRDAVSRDTVSADPASSDAETADAAPGRPGEADDAGSAGGTWSGAQSGWDEQAWQAPSGGQPGWPGGPAGSPGAGPPRTGGLISRITRFLQTAWTCPSCGHGALPSDKFCQKCGARIHPPTWNQAADDDDGRPPLAPAMLCGSCGTRISAGNLYCTHCGTKRP